ncbi:MAG: hypothetical protein GY757_36440 [bacterium]|nr:hypothetical protein [bacterium]
MTLSTGCSKENDEKNYSVTEENGIKIIKNKKIPENKKPAISITEVFQITGVPENTGDTEKEGEAELFWPRSLDIDP